VKRIFLINLKNEVLQPAQHAANNFPFLSSGLHEIQAFLHQKYYEGLSFVYIFANDLAKNRDFGKFPSNRLTYKDFFHEIGFFHIFLGYN